MSAFSDMSVVTLQLLLKFALTLLWIIPWQEVSYEFCDWKRQLCIWNTSSIAWEGSPALEEPDLLNKFLCVCVGG